MLALKMIPNVYACLSIAGISDNLSLCIDNKHGQHESCHECHYQMDLSDQQNIEEAHILLLTCSCMCIVTLLLTTRKMYVCNHMDVHDTIYHVGINMQNKTLMKSHEN